MPDWVKKEWQRRGLATVVLGVLLIIFNLILNTYSAEIKTFLDAYGPRGASNVFQAMLQTNFLILLAFLCFLWSAIKYGFSEIRDKALIPQLASAEASVSGKIEAGFSQIAAELRNAITDTVPEMIDTTTLAVLKEKISSPDTLERAAVIINTKLYGGTSPFALNYAEYLQSDLIKLVRNTHPFFRVDFSVAGHIAENLKKLREDDGRVAYEVVYKYELHPADGSTATGPLPARVWIDAEPSQLREALAALGLEVSVTLGTQTRRSSFDDAMREEAYDRLTKNPGTSIDIKPFRVSFDNRQLTLMTEDSVTAGRLGTTVNILVRSLINREDRFQTITASMPTRNADIRFDIRDGLPYWHFSSMNLSPMNMPARPPAMPNRYERVHHEPRFIWYKVNDWLMPGIVATLEWNFPR